MTFQKSDLIKVAHLARLKLTDPEMHKFQDDLTRIVDFVAQLNEVDVSDVEPMAHAGDRALFLREDEAMATLGRECLVSSAGFEDGLIRVPKIIE